MNLLSTFSENYQRFSVESIKDFSVEFIKNFSVEFIKEGAKKGKKKRKKKKNGAEGTPNIFRACAPN